jgi:hypothetical protein
MFIQSDQRATYVVENLVEPQACGRNLCKFILHECTLETKTIFVFLRLRPN